MLFSDLRSFVERKGSIEQAELLDKAAIILNELDIEEWMQSFSMKYGGLDGTHGVYDVQSIMQDFEDVMAAIIGRHGIVIKSEANLNFLIRLTTALQDVPYYEDKETLLGICEKVLTDAEIIAEIIQTVSGIDAHELLHYLEDVDASIIDRVKATITASMADEVNNETVELCIASYKRYVESIRTPNMARHINSDHLFSDNTPDTEADVDFVPKGLNLDTLLNNRDTIGKPFAWYFDIYKMYTTKELDKKTAEEIAMDMIGLACLSSDGYANQLPVIRERLNELVPDAKQSMAVDLAVMNLLQKVPANA